MTQEKWTKVDQYIANMLVASDPVLDAVLQTSNAAGLPPINVAPNQGKLLMLLAQIQNAHSILEIGTLAGYSTIWLARALPPTGHLVTLEIDPICAKVAMANFELAGLSHVIELRVGHALDTLPKLATKGDQFDLIFIDADKRNNPNYFTWALKLSRPGSLIIVDNVVRDGAVIDTTSNDPSVQGVRRLNELVAVEPRVSATAIQTVGTKGYDGLLFARVIA